MQIIATINDLNSLKDLEKVVDTIAVPTPFSSYTEVRFNFSDIKYLVNSATKPLYLLVNGLYEDKDMKGVEELIREYKDKVHYIFGDLGVLDLLLELGLEKNSIYNPTTLICNSLDGQEYLNYGLEAVGLSLEMPVVDMASINKAVDNKTLIKVFGYHPMFISKRNLITTYLDHIDEDNKSRKGYLVEEKRPDKLPIIEDSIGTTIYRHYPINLIKEIDAVSSADFLYFNSTFLDNETFIKTIGIYKDTINGSITKAKAFDLLVNMFPYEDGFIYDDSIYEERDF